jgi:small subunit ribosomal protein S2
VIPGNDDAIRAIKLYVTAVADACLAGKAEAGGGVAASDEFVEVAAAAAEEAAGQRKPGAGQPPADRPLLT